MEKKTRIKASAVPVPLQPLSDTELAAFSGGAGVDECHGCPIGGIDLGR
jgi:hypothetical protein